MASTDNRFTNDAHYHGGALGRANLQWGMSFNSVLASPPDPAIAGTDWQARWLKRLDAAPAIISDWMTHQTFDEYWQRGSVALNYDSITVPVLISGGWQDTYSNRAIPLLEGLGANTWAVIGPANFQGFLSFGSHDRPTFALLILFELFPFPVYIYSCNMFFFPRAFFV